MSTTTSNLGLFKYDTTADRDSAFSVDTALNNNWDKLDKAITLDKAQTMTATKTFKNAGLGQSIVINRDQANSVAAIQYQVQGTNKGYMGIDGSAIPVYISSSTAVQELVRNKTRSTATGSTATPVYIDAKGIAQTCTNISASSATTATKLGSSNIGTTATPIYLAAGTPKACTASFLTATTSLSENGYVKFNNSIIMTWQFVTESNAQTDYRQFPISFPTKVCFCEASDAPWINLGTYGNTVAWVGIYDKTKFICGIGPNLLPGAEKNVQVFAIGY